MSYDYQVFTPPENEILSAFALIVWFYKLHPWNCARKGAWKAGFEAESLSTQGHSLDLLLQEFTELVLIWTIPSSASYKLALSQALWHEQGQTHQRHICALWFNPRNKLTGGRCDPFHRLRKKNEV